MPLCYREERHSLLVREEDYASSLQRLEASSSLHREGVCLMSVEKKDTLSSPERRSLPPLYTEGVCLLSIEKRYNASSP